MHKLLIVVVVVAAIALQCEAKQFDRCGLVRELRKQGFPEDKMRDWVCLVEHESSRNTGKTNKNKNGSRDHGLFQINDKYWCTSKGPAGKDCNVKCADVMTPNITKASACAKKIYKRHNFQAWYGWKNHCQNRGSLPDISKC